MATESRLPAAPEALPGEMTSLVEKLATAWASDTSRPRPSQQVLAGWKALLDEWIDDRSLPLLVRKRGERSRGSVVRHPTGRDIVPVDNSPAQWAFEQAMMGSVPTIGQIHPMLERGELPVAMIITAVERADPEVKFRGALNSKSGTAVLGWKLAHIERIGLKTRGDAATLPIDQLELHFRRFMDPANMFVIPLKYAGLAEIPEFCDAIRATLAPTE